VQNQCKSIKCFSAFFQIGLVGKSRFFFRWLLDKNQSKTQKSSETIFLSILRFSQICPDSLSGTQQSTFSFKYCAAKATKNAFKQASNKDPINQD